MGTVDARLKELGITLPEPRPPAGLYNPVLVDGDLAFTSGLVAIENDAIAYVGALGDELTVEEGKRSARGACLLALGTLARGIGGLDRVAQVLKLTGFVRAVPTFKDLPPVLDGASELLLDVLGDQGKGARTTVGVAALPGYASVELDLVVRLKAA